MKADLRSVKISELAQKLTEIATFLFQKGGKRAEKIFRFLDFGAISFAYRERKKEEILSRTKLSLRHFDIFRVKFYQLFAKTIR